MTAMRRSDANNAVLSRGFTLVEMIVVIVITGIIVAAVAVFIRAPVQGYVDLVARAELADEADTAVRRMSRDLRLALPNSIRVSVQSNGSNYLELLLTNTGGRYLTDTDDASLGGDILSFTDSGDTSFRVVGDLSTDPTRQIREGNWIVVYNLGAGQAPADAYCTGPSCNNRARVAEDVVVPSKIINLSSPNPFAPSPPVPANPAGGAGAFPSPGNRFQVVTTPVTYECNPTAGTLTRYSNYAISAAQPIAAPTTPMAAGANVVIGLLANGVTACNFAYDNSATNTSQALVGITLTMQRPSTNSGAIALFHQVHVDNTP